LPAGDACARRHTGHERRPPSARAQIRYVDRAYGGGRLCRAGRDRRGGGMVRQGRRAGRRAPGRAGAKAPHGVYLSDAGRLLASPADQTPMEPCDVQPDDLDVAIAVNRIQRAAALPIVHIERKWAGLRSFVADGCPVVGYDPEVKGFFWLAGQGGYGIETSPAMGRLGASLALGRGVPRDLAASGVSEAVLSPGRFARA